VRSMAAQPACASSTASTANSTSNHCAPQPVLDEARIVRVLRYWQSTAYLEQPAICQQCGGSGLAQLEQAMATVARWPDGVCSSRQRKQLSDLHCCLFTLLLQVGHNLHRHRHVC
jgi:hypothetical protein